MAQPTRGAELCAGGDVGSVAYPDPGLELVDADPQGRGAPRNPGEDGLKPLLVTIEQSVLRQAGQAIQQNNVVRLRQPIGVGRLLPIITLTSPPWERRRLADEILSR